MNLPIMSCTVSYSACTVNWLSCSALAMHTHKKKRAEYCANARLSTVGGRRFWNAINGYTVYLDRVLILKPTYQPF